MFQEKEIMMKKKTIKLQDIGSLLALIFLVILISIFSSDFRSVSNFLSLLRQSAINGLIAFGMTFVILTGGIDLSVGSVLSLTAVISAGMIKSGIPVPIVLPGALLMGIILGVLNGIMVAKYKIQPFIATLITMTAFRGFTMIYTQGSPVSRLGKSALLHNLGKGFILGIPVPAWILLLLFAVFWTLLNKTTLGRKIYATGCNPKAAEITGIKTGRVELFVYALSGMTAALAGLILVSRLGSAQPTLGTGFELDAIAAVALGGTSMSGGKGSIGKTLIGILIIAVLNNGLNILGVSSYYQSVVKALVILIAVLSDRNR